MGRLVGDPGMQKLMSSHVMIIGLGGVGSYAAEAIVRAGVGEVTIVDFDEICITNFCSAGSQRKRFGSSTQAMRSVMLTSPPRVMSARWLLRRMPTQRRS